MCVAYGTLPPSGRVTERERGDQSVSMQLFAIIEDDTYNSVRERQARDGTSIHTEVDSLLRAGLDATRQQSEDARRYLEQTSGPAVPDAADDAHAAGPDPAGARVTGGDAFPEATGPEPEVRADSMPNASSARAQGASDMPVEGDLSETIPSPGEAQDDGSAQAAPGQGPERPAGSASTDGETERPDGAREHGANPGEPVARPQEGTAQAGVSQTTTDGAAGGLEAAEARILDAMQIDPEARAGAIAALAPEDFDDVNRRRLFEVIRSMAAVGRHIDYGTVGTCAQIYYPKDCYGIREAQLALPKGISPVAGWPVDVSAIVAARTDEAGGPEGGTAGARDQQPEGVAADGAGDRPEEAPSETAVDAPAGGVQVPEAHGEHTVVGDAPAKAQGAEVAPVAAGAGAAAGRDVPAEAEGERASEETPSDERPNESDGHDPQLVVRALANFGLRPAEDSGGEWGTVATSEDGRVSVVEVMWNDDGSGKASIDPSALGAISAVERARARSYLRAHDGLASVGVALLSLAIGDGTLDAALWRDAMQVDRES